MSYEIHVLPPTNLPSESPDFEKVRARDAWHLTSRIVRKVLAYTLGIFINRQTGRSDLQFEGLIA